jgi:hypothetical protein
MARWLDRHRPRAPADIPGVPAFGTAESGRREAAVAQMIDGRINGAMLVAAGAAFVLLSQWIEAISASLR